MSEKLSPNLEQACHGFSGACGSLITTFLLYPIDNIKTKMQVNIDEEGEEEEKDGSSKKSKNFFSIVKKTIMEESFLELYTGLTPDAVGNFISNGTFFLLYEKAKRNVDTSSLSGYIYAATIASSLTTIITNPFRVVNTKMIIKNKQESLLKEKKTVLDHIREIFEKEGFKGFFTGTGSSLILIINPIINYVIYEYLKKFFKDSKRKTLMFFISGAISKAIATIITYPVQVVRTNLMVEKKNIQEITKKILENEGMKGFYSGLSPKLVQSVINSAIMLFLYEKLFKVNRTIFILILKKFQ